jgi:hypothetical protein
MYCFSKIWFRTHCVDLRGTDSNKITSSAKSWLYADMLMKPEEIVLHRPVSSGGLALLHVKMKALAGLIRCFLETACMPDIMSLRIGLFQILDYLHSTTMSSLL